VIGRDLVERPERVLGPERWYGAVDCVGGNVLAAVLRSMRYGGVVAASGLTGGSELSTTVYPFIVRAVSLIGIDTVQTPIDERVAVWSDLATAFDVETLDAMVAKEVGLDELSEALATIIAGGVRGRILVQPGR
jgi:acrylyl-CoA reductase (NADPH)